MSWDTLVISSVFILSFFTLFSTAASRPSPMRLIYSAMVRCSPVSWSRGILYWRSPSVIFFSPSRMCSLPRAFLKRYTSPAASAAPRIRIRTGIPPTKIIPHTTNWKRQKPPKISVIFRRLEVLTANSSTISFSSAHPFLRNFPAARMKHLVKLFFQSAPALILLTRLSQPMKNQIPVHRPRILKMIKYPSVSISRLQVIIFSNDVAPASQIPTTRRAAISVNHRSKKFRRISSSSLARPAPAVRKPTQTAKRIMEKSPQIKIGVSHPAYFS